MRGYGKCLLFHRQVFLREVAAQKVFRLENMTTKEKILLTLKLLLYTPDIGQFWQYIVCSAELAYVPVRIIGTLEYSEN